jgi:hypothetical protein
MAMLSCGRKTQNGAPLAKLPPREVCHKSHNFAASPDYFDWSKRASGFAAKVDVAAAFTIWNV